MTIAITRYEPDGSSTNWYWVVRPEVPIDAAASEVHGLSDEDVADCPPFTAVAGAIANVLEGADIGGYGVRGDVDILESEMARAKQAWTPADGCVIDGLRLWQLREQRRLQDAYEKFVGPLPENVNAHHAACDVAMTAAVIAALRDGKTIGELHAACNDGKVDIAGKFRYDNKQRVIFAFGPARGAVATTRPDLLSWMLQKDFAPSTLAVARRLLDEAWAPAPEAETEATGDDPNRGGQKNDQAEVTKRS